MARTLEDVRAEATQNIERLNTYSRQWEDTKALLLTLGVSESEMALRDAEFYLKWNHCCWLMAPVMALLPDLELPPRGSASPLVGQD